MLTAGRLQHQRRLWSLLACNWLHLLSEHFIAFGRLEGGWVRLAQIEADEFTSRLARLRIVRALAKNNPKAGGRPGFSRAHQRLAVADLSGRGGHCGAMTVNFDTHDGVRAEVFAHRLHRRRMRQNRTSRNGTRYREDGA